MNNKQHPPISNPTPKKSDPHRQLLLQKGRGQAILKKLGSLNSDDMPNSTWI